jgi:hypothetical protein
VGCGEGAAYQWLVACGDVEDCAAAGSVEPPNIVISISMLLLCIEGGDRREEKERITYDNSTRKNPDPVPPNPNQHVPPHARHQYNSTHPPLYTHA